jgi:hypothetical protein
MTTPSPMFRIVEVPFEIFGHGPLESRLFLLRLTIIPNTTFRWLCLKDFLKCELVIAGMTSSASIARH